MKETVVFGIDIGSSMVKALAGVVDNNGQVILKGNGSVPSSCMDKGRLTNISALADSVAEVIECTAMAASRTPDAVFLGLGGTMLSTVNSRGSIAPANPSSITRLDIERACKASVLTAVIPEENEVLHIVPQRFLVDGKSAAGLPLQCKGSRLEVDAHIVSAPKDIIDSITVALKRKAVVLSGIYSGAIAAALTLVTESGASDCFYIDIGSGVTDVILFRDSKIILSASLPLGGDYITSDIMQALGIGWEHAEEVKRYYARLDKSIKGQNAVLDCNDYGTTDKHVPYDFLNFVVESRVDEIVTLVYDYVKTMVDELKVERILLTGGCAIMPSIAERISASFGLPAQAAGVKNILTEYSHPTNAVSYGIVSYAAMNMPFEQQKNAATWRTLLGRFKKIFA